MSKVSLRRLLSKLTVLALSAGAAAPAVGATVSEPTPNRETRDVIDDDACDLDATLPIDREHVDPRDAASALGRGLALALARMRPLSATHVASTWALADDGVRRLAIAHALEWAFPLVGDSIMLDHLSHDDDAGVRAAVARAAWVRRSAGGDAGVLTRLARDADPEVRSIVARSQR
jgi:hypothetical protein